MSVLHALLEWFGASSDDNEFHKDVYIDHTHGHQWERQGFVGTDETDIVEIFECRDCDAWTAIEKPQDTRQPWNLGSIPDDEEIADYKKVIRDGGKS